MTHRFSLTIEASSPDELRSEALTIFARLMETIPEPGHVSGPITELSPAFQADLKSFQGEFSAQLLRYVCDQAVAGQPATSSNFKDQVGRQGQDGRWIGGVTAAVNRVLQRHAGVILDSKYDEAGAASWTIPADLAAKVLKVL